MKEKKLAIITARGGSKRIPRKNIRDFCGKPIIAYSIEAAISSQLFDEVMVSTDDEEIAQVAKTYGAVVPFLRSNDTSNDYATTADVLTEVFSKYENLNKRFSQACCIYPTAPFVSSKRIIESFRMLKSEKTDTVIPIVKFSYPPQRGLVRRGDCIVLKYPELENKRSQDLETMYHDAGQFYSFKIPAFLKRGSLLSGRISYIELSELEAQDIDNEIDWRLAELKYSLMINE